MSSINENEMVTRLVEAGGNEWVGGPHHRVYFNRADVVATIAPFGRVNHYAGREDIPDKIFWDVKKSEWVGMDLNSYSIKSIQKRIDDAKSVLAEAGFEVTKYGSFASGFKFACYPKDSERPRMAKDCAAMAEPWKKFQEAFEEAAMVEELIEKLEIV